ncbi:hypothetical protein NOVOSPHI9U_370043 [Novosphingobium sp. 9U]|nr:hypothetical protein NOVOSPHI9U_370043 [Novosphingobium sp. 9U]
MFETISLAKLQLSASNVRKVIDPAADLQLSHDIEARGLLQNLIVAKAKKRGMFDVIAGGRRLRAMNLIIERGAWTKDQEVSCLVFTGDEAAISETSLAENFQRMAMTPADECRAFQHFIGTDGSIDAVAKRFGQTRRFIEGRLRLAALAEPIFDALAEGKITLDLAKAYASTDNHEKQLRVFQTYGTGGYGYGNTADSIRRAIAQGGVSGKDPIALLVGEDAYVAEGGRIERDLFTDKAEDTWCDPEILERLAGERLEAEAKRLAETNGLAWIRPVASTDTWQLRENLHRVQLPPAPLSEEAATRLAEIHARNEEISAEMEDEGLSDDRYAELEAEFEKLSEEAEAVSTTTPVLPDEWKGQVGMILKLSREGEMVLEPTYYSETPLRIEADEEGNLVLLRRRRRPAPVVTPPRPSAPRPSHLAVRHSAPVSMTNSLCSAVTSSPPTCCAIRVSRSTTRSSRSSTTSAACTLAPRSAAGASKIRTWAICRSPRLARFSPKRMRRWTAAGPTTTTMSPASTPSGRSTTTPRVPGTPTRWRCRCRRSRLTTSARTRCRTGSASCSRSMWRPGGVQPRPTSSTASRRAVSCSSCTTLADRPCRAAMPRPRSPTSRPTARSCAPARRSSKRTCASALSPGCPTPCCSSNPRWPRPTRWTA